MGGRRLDDAVGVLVICRGVRMQAESAVNLLYR